MKAGRLRLQWWCKHCKHEQGRGARRTQWQRVVAVYVPMRPMGGLSDIMKACVHMSTVGYSGMLARGVGVLSGPFPQQAGCLWGARLPP